VESTGVLVESTGVLVESTGVYWTGVHVESTQSPHGLHIDSIENI